MSTFDTFLILSGLCMNGMHSKVLLLLAGNQPVVTQEGVDPVKVKVGWGKGLYDNSDKNFTLLINKVQGPKTSVIFSIEVTGEHDVTVRLPEGYKSPLRQVITDSLKGFKIIWIEKFEFITK